jgi:hypothetical protein
MSTSPAVKRVRSAWTFFALVYALSLPLWLISRHVSGNALPDHLPPTDALATFLPTIAACILAHRQGGGSAVQQLLARALDYDLLRGEMRFWRPGPELKFHR